MKVYFDTNVLVAAAVEDHPHYAPAEAMLRKVHSGEIQACITAHGLAEFYAVLTRLPSAPPVYPNEAWQILERDVLPHFQVLSLSEEAYKKALQDCVKAGWTGGRVYDMLHLAAARQAGCQQICTFNVRHFRELAPDLAEQIRAPS